MKAQHFARSIVLPLAVVSLIAACGGSGGGGGGLTDEELARFVGPDVGTVLQFRREFPGSDQRPQNDYAKSLRSNGPFHVEVAHQIAEGRPDWDNLARPGIHTFELEVRDRELVRRDRNGILVLLTGPLLPHAAQWPGYRSETCTITAVESREFASAPRRVVEVTCDLKSPEGTFRTVRVLAEQLGIVEERRYLTPTRNAELQLYEKQLLIRSSGR
jgi:hypothetical protein